MITCRSLAEGSIDLADSTGTHAPFGASRPEYFDK